MNKIINAILLAIASVFPAYATEATCAQQAQLAGTIMRARQSGVPMSKAMDIVRGSRVSEVMVEYAYSEPRYLSDLYIDRSVQEMENMAYAICHKIQNEVQRQSARKPKAELGT